ncbi:hypothetical protein FRC07_007859 [Ceratobasidium sp. 392]|nr:hypothetical protein FRC07_007859 [Ceratobasidium sp. 392]
MLDRIDSKTRKDWWRAQCAFRRLSSSRQKRVDELQSALDEALNQANDIPPDLLALETAARAQFRQAILSAQSFISALSFSPPVDSGPPASLTSHLAPAPVSTVSSRSTIPSRSTVATSAVPYSVAGPSSSAPRKLPQRRTSSRLRSASITLDRPTEQIKRARINNKGSRGSPNDPSDAALNHSDIHMWGGVSAHLNTVRGRKKAFNSRVEAFMKQMFGASLDMRRRKADGIMNRLAESENASIPAAGSSSGKMPTVGGTWEGEH